MILVDTNLLVYARIKSFAQSARAHAWLDEKLNGSAPVGLPWPSLLGFVRITTNQRILERPLTTAQAWVQVTQWLARPPVWIPNPGDAHPEILGALLTASGATANLVPDAHLAALAIEHGLRMCSTDGDFARFTGLTWENPLAN